MSKKIIAIGGGENGRIKNNGIKTPYELEPIDKEIIALTNKNKPNFLFIGHALTSLEAQDNYYDLLKNMYENKYGCNCTQLKTDDLYDENKTNRLIEWSDIIYIGGGSTLELVELWNKTGFDKTIKKAYENGKIICGISAGANVLFENCISDSLQIKYGDDQPLIKLKCLGLVEGLFVPHCNKEGRIETVKDILATTNEVAILMSNCAALEIIDDEYRIITCDASFHGINAYGLRIYWNGYEYVTENIEESKNFKSLKKLLNK